MGIYKPETVLMLGVERYFVVQGERGPIDPRTRDVPEGVVAQCNSAKFATRIALALNFLEENDK